MKKKNEKQPISLRFLFFLSMAIIVLLVYATSPNSLKEIKNSKTYEEMLEYTRKVPTHEVQKEQKVQTTRESTTQPKTSYTKQEVKQTPILNKQTGKEEKYKALLDKMQRYSPKSVISAENIVKDILKFKGYPENTIKVITDESENLIQKTQGSYIAATFNISTGNMHINKTPLYALKIEELIAIISHELDHFEKISQVCKFMGIESFNQTLSQNNMKNINYEFWNNAQKYANIEGFDGNFYKNALIRYINQSSIDLTSSYSDLYRLSEHVRNPLEISAYEISDKVFEYYNIPNEDGPLKKLISQFNTLDWTIYNSLSKNELLKKERIAFFDYYFMNAIISVHPKYKAEFDNCIKNKNGNMTSFWLAFEKDNEKFYNKNMQLDEATYNNIFKLIKETETKAKLPLTKEIACNAIKYKVNTLLANIVFPNAVKFIESGALNYLQYINKENIKAPKDELQMILILMCIENNFYKKTTLEIPSLYYIKLPKEIETLYNISNKNRRFHFIYNNQEFINLLQQEKRINSNITEQILLQKLLYETRLNDRNQYN
ncbi:MAG: hypothetical protein E7Z90_06525 [Cyanobacteria bacterium SIG29]|nr:hypothetical protein [Cyanobacteria bacterium SIG29]